MVKSDMHYLMYIQFVHSMGNDGYNTQYPNVETLIESVFLYTAWGFYFHFCTTRINLEMHPETSIQWFSGARAVLGLTFYNSVLSAFTLSTDLTWRMYFIDLVNSRRQCGKSIDFRLFVDI